MNMKKTIAAIAAGAVAVSAMATTVSALADTSLPYNLVKKYEVKSSDAHKATYEFTINVGEPADAKDAVPATFEAKVTEAATSTPDIVLDSKNVYTAAAKYTFVTDLGNKVDADGFYDEDLNKMPETIKYTGTAEKGDVIEVTEKTPAVDAVAAVAYPTEIKFKSADKVKSMVIKVASNEAGEQNKVYTYSTDKKALNYNAGLSDTGLILTNELAGYKGALAITVTVNTETDYDKIEKINDAIDKGVVSTANEGATSITAKAFTKGGDKVTEYMVPFKTEIKNNVNITRYLQEDSYPVHKFADGKPRVIANGLGYHNVGAVLNDAIENYESVTFTFNTATSGIIWTVRNESTGEEFFDKYYVRNGAYGNGDDKDGGNYSQALAAAAIGTWNSSSYIAGGPAQVAEVLAYYSADWFADTSYTSFDQHLYQGTNGVYGSYITSYGSENTGYTGFDWTGYNLFQGALVINENLTMSLAETDYFDWTATSLSFDWDAIMDGAMTSNDYAAYLHSMKLATSNTWYWDNMVVTLTAGAAEDGVDAEAGVEADDEELAEEEVEEEVVEEEPVEEEEVEVEVANPTTGNASVALAVIPVALAAAAVVAKKRS